MTELFSLLGYGTTVTAMVAAYILFGLSLAILSRATGIGRRWMAWVPFANGYLLGRLADVYTDRRLTTDKDRADPFYTPSTLRRKILGFGIGAAFAGAVTVAAISICIMIGAFFFFFLLSGLPAKGDPPVDIPPGTDMLFLISGLTAFVTGIFCLILAILFLMAFCPALCRVLTALEVPCPALWTALGVFVPLAAAIVLLIYTNRAGNPASAFAPNRAGGGAHHPA